MFQEDISSSPIGQAVQSSVDDDNDQACLEIATSSEQSYCEILRTEIQASRSAASALKAELHLNQRLGVNRKSQSERWLLPAQLVPPTPDPALPVMFHLDIFDCSVQDCRLVGWAFCPWFDAHQATLQILFEAQNGQQFVMTLPKRQRPDVAAHFAGYDFNRHFENLGSLTSSQLGNKRLAWLRGKSTSLPEPLPLVLPPERPAALDWSGFDGWFTCAALPMGPTTLHIRIVEGLRCAGAVIKTAVTFR
ncbi:MAG: hypothetical protein H6974_05945 [Gammaproteobacteria bacterium]|nr:hypothetical protein [Gammaproteobacteria bacterium]